MRLTTWRGEVCLLGWQWPRGHCLAWCIAKYSSDRSAKISFPSSPSSRSSPVLSSLSPSPSLLSPLSLSVRTDADYPTWTGLNSLYRLKHDVNSTNSLHYKNRERVAGAMYFIIFDSHDQGNSRKWQGFDLSRIFQHLYSNSTKIMPFMMS